MYCRERIFVQPLRAIEVSAARLKSKCYQMIAIIIVSTASQLICPVEERYVVSNNSEKLGIGLV